ncbi:MAG: galactokinase [Planctomycetota bacterium]
MAASPLTRIELYFSSRFERDPQGVVFTPGRLVLLGEHVDHQGGPVLAVPLRLGVYVAWAVRPDRRVALHALNARATDTFNQGEGVRTGRRWADLARGAFAELGKDGRRLPGLDLAILGDLPTARGLASSAAYTVGILRAILFAIEEKATPREFAQHAAEIESQWGGVRCGLMDPYVVTAGRPGEVVWLNTSSLTHDTFSLPPDTRLQMLDTGIRRRLDETPYNERLREIHAAMAALREKDDEIDELVEMTPDAFAAVEEGAPEPARSRARHVVTEVARVKRAVDALRKGDGETLGRLMNECHESLARDFDSSLPEIDAKLKEIRKEPDVLGARLQGAGWGGTMVVLRRAK